MRFLLNENVGKKVADHLQLLGHFVLPINEKAGRHRLNSDLLETKWGILYSKLFLNLIQHHYLKWCIISDIMTQIHTIVWKEGNWYVAKALEVEVASQGETEEEALKNLQEALELYFEDKHDIELAPVSAPKLQEIPVQLNA